MLTEQEKQIVLFGKQNGKKDDEILNALSKYRSTQVATETPDTTQSRLADVGEKTATRMSEAISGTGQYEDASLLRRGVGATAAGFSAVPSGALALAPESVREGVKKVGDVIGKGFNFLTDKISNTKLFSDIGKLEAQGYINPKDNPEFYALKDALATTAETAEIAGTIAGAEGTVSTLAKTGNITKKVGSLGLGATTKLVNGATGIVKTKVMPKLGTPVKDLKGTVGEVLQGKPSDIPRGIDSFRAIDTTDVKTYAELGKRIDDSISTLSRKVDDELSQDLTKTRLSDLQTELKTKSGISVKTNYVDTALRQMKELYEKTGDVKKAADIEELINIANSEGLTKLDINNIARVYNAEFGSKAFGKLGEPLTSVNAQLYETVRKGVKVKAREGIGGKEAKLADETVSSLYNTKSLVTKNIDAVNKLQQKIAERGMLEKAGYLVSKYADILTGGSIRGFIGGILPRGAGYKTMNALDIEKRLQQNLEIINRASSATTDAEMTKILSEIGLD
jgi:hypothetical protein